MSARESMRQIAAPSIYWMWAVRLVMFALPVIIAVSSYYLVAEIRIAIMTNNEALRQEIASKYVTRETWDNWQRWVYEESHHDHTN